MADALALKQIFSIQSAAWAVVALIFLLIVRMWNGAPAMLETWILWRQSKAAEKASDWHRLRDEIRRLSEAEERCRSDFANLHRKHMELHQEYADISRRVAELEGWQTGQGRASQEAAGVVALERMDRNKKPPEGK